MKRANSIIQSQLISILMDFQEPEPPREPANTEEARRREICEFLQNRGVKRALIDNEQFYFCENIDNGKEEEGRKNKTVQG